MAFVAAACLFAGGTPAHGATDREGEVQIAFDCSGGQGTAVQTLALPRNQGLVVRGQPLEVRVDQVQEGTPVVMADGSFCRVLATSPLRTHGVRASKGGRRVVGISKRFVESLTVVRTEAETLATTADHRFFVRGKGWVGAGKLQTGDLLQDTRGDPVAVVAVEHKAVPPTAVYNYQVEEFHTYHVGRRGVLVHNGSCLSNPTLRFGARKEIAALQEEALVLDESLPRADLLTEGQMKTLLSEEEFSAIGAFTRAGGDYADLRSAQGRTAAELVEFRRWDPGRVRQLHEQGDALERAIAKLPKEEGRVYRGMSGVSAETIAGYIDRWKDGRAIQLGPLGKGATTSASLSIQIADGYASRPAAASLYRVIYRIDQKSGVVVANGSDQVHEQEVLLPKGARYVVTKVARVAGEPNKVLVDLREKNESLLSRMSPLR